jgi:hypothetical protein
MRQMSESRVGLCVTAQSYSPAPSSRPLYSSGVTGKGGPRVGSAVGSTGKISVTSSPPAGLPGGFK